MGRAKLEMKYRDESRARINTYKTRIKGMVKKAEELSVLCGVDVLFASFSPDLKAVHYWPKNATEFHRILHRYKSISSNPPGAVPSPPLSSTFQEELVAMNEKLEEINERISFLEAENVRGLSSSTQQACAQISSITMEDKEKEDEDIYSMLEDLDNDLIVSDVPLISCFSDKCNLHSKNYSTPFCSDLDNLSKIFSYC